jgi:hypothetical protein
LTPSFFGSGVPLYVVKLFGRALIEADEPYGSAELPRQPLPAHGESRTA